MKTIIKQLLKALCYFLLFVGSQFVVTFALEFLYGIKVGLEATASGEVLNDQVLVERAMEFLTRYSNIILLVSGLLTLFILWIFFLIRKKKLYKEACIAKFDKKKILPIILMGMAFALFVVCILNLLPLPESLLSSYEQSTYSLTVGNVAVQLIAIVIVAPVVEEVIFRGLILSRLKKAMSVPVAILLNSLVFGLVHGQLLWIAYAFCLGVVLCVVVEKTGSLATSILLHMAFNFAGTLEIDFITEIWQVVILAIVSLGILVGMSHLVLKKEKQVAVEEAVI